jgi:DNA-binding NtrC family response regulator
LENRRSLLGILDAFSLNVISCCALDQAREVLARQDVPLVFCDEFLSDGSYRQLLAFDELKRRIPRVVVTIRTGEWDEYLEAMKLGAYDALRCPIRPTDVEIIVLRALREGRQSLPERMIA